MPDLAVGGQAVIEGVMMRSNDKISTAVRLPSGEIVIKTDNYKSKTKSAKMFGWPIIRGIITFVEMLIIGIRTLNFSADIAVKEIEKEEALAKGEEYKEEDKKSNNLILIGTAIFAVALGIGIFFFLPLAISTWFKVDKDAIAFNLVSGLIRVTLFVLYVWIISFFGEFKRVFQYHGAEHKSIYAHENGEELTVENVKRYSTLHPRCGTSFILIVALFAMIVYSISDTSYFLITGESPTLIKRFLIHFSLLPLVAGSSYEILKLSGKTRDNSITKFLIKPGLWLQRITTREPSPEQMEVAIIALESALGATESNIDIKKTCL